MSLQAAMDFLDPLRVAVVESARRFVKPQGIVFSYGTAGFRADAATLDAVVHRTAILAALRSLHSGGRATGVMVTASHNPEGDNGVKVADPSGGMLAAQWEKYATQLANAETEEQLWQAVQHLVASEAISLGLGSPQGLVLLGRDTRPSGPRLLQAAEQGVAVVPGVRAHAYGTVTTPQLHWLVRETNAAEHGSEEPSEEPNSREQPPPLDASGSDQAAQANPSQPPAPSPRPPPPSSVAPESSFLCSLVGAFAAFVLTCGPGRTSIASSTSESSSTGIGSSTPGVAAAQVPSGAHGAASFTAPVPPASPLPPLLVDAANGVGGAQLQRLLACLRSEQGIELRVAVRNGGPEAAPDGSGGSSGSGGSCSGGSGRLNDGVGADFVQKELRPPAGFSAEADAHCRCASFDGDADRLVFFFWSQCSDGGTGAPLFRLLDGDKTAALILCFLSHCLAALDPSPPSAQAPAARPALRQFSIPGFGPVSLGAVQTAYANGASSCFLEQRLGVQVVTTATGVKHLHRAAEAFDIGVYFEANGHGTVLLSAALREWLRRALAELPHSSGEGLALRRLWWALQMFNAAVGDALANLLAVEALLLLGQAERAQRQGADKLGEGHSSGWQQGELPPLPSTFEEWDALYSDLPSRQLKVKVADRQAFKTTSSETRLLEPSSLQPLIDQAVGNIPDGRAFVRPSGTEDVVRVYAEARTREDADSLAKNVAELVLKHA